MTSNRAAKRHANAPDLHLYGYWPNKIRKWRRDLTRPFTLDEWAFERPVPGRLLALSKVGRRARYGRRTR